MLTVNKVKKSYGDFNLDCSFEVKPDTITGLIGKNGAGKTTVLKAILGLISPEEGNISLFNKDPETLDLNDKKKIGVVFSESGFNKNLTPNDLKSILENLYESFDKIFFSWELKRMEIPANKKIKNLSTGMQARLKILIALSLHPQFLILDEPTVGLDVVARNEVYNQLRTYMNDNKNCSILISSHNSNDLGSLCDDLYLIDDGKIIFHEDADKILDDYGIIKVTPEQFASISPNYILRYSKEVYGYKCLTDQKQFYIENYPDINIEKGSIDELLTLFINGQTLGTF